MNNQIIVFSAYEPDINSGGNSMIPHIIKTINKMYVKPIVYFHIQYTNKHFDNIFQTYTEMCKYEEEYLPIMKPYMFFNKNNIVIYPENSPNVLGFNNIVRFNFYFNMGNPCNDNEYTIFFASPFYRLFNKVRTMFNLPIYEINPKNSFPKYINYFYNIDKLLEKCVDYGLPRNGACYTMRKGCIHPHQRENIQYNPHPQDAYSIPHELSNPDDLIPIFNRYKYFYSYDGFTNMLQMAALCGCIPIIVPFKYFDTINDFWEEGWFTNGIAYGDSCQEIQRALDTRQNMIDELIKIKNQNFTVLYREVIESIFCFFCKNENNNIDKLLIENKYNKHNNICLIYTLKYTENNNKILIIADKNKLNIDNLIGDTFIIDNIENINSECVKTIENLLDTRKYGYIFCQYTINNLNYRLKTHIFLDNNNNKYILSPYVYIPPKIINNSYIQTFTNLNINNNLSIPPYIYDYRPMYGPSKIIWAISNNNFSNDHWIINTINNIGFSFYKRKTNLINVLRLYDNDEINKYNKFISNPLNICIYQETGSNVLNMKNICHINWFFDPRPNQTFSNNTLFIDQFPIYEIKRNIFRQKYNGDININNYNTYPNCFPCLFNVASFLELAKSNARPVVTYNSCFVLRKTVDQHSLKMMEQISDYYIHPDTSLQIDGLDLQNTINIFLNSHTFYCYDLVTFLPVIALICGCKPIIISDYPSFKDMRDIYKEYNPWMYYGITYYIDGEYIEPEENGREKLINLLTLISNNSFKNFSTETTSYNNLLLFLKYLEVYFDVSFCE